MTEFKDKTLLFDSYLLLARSLSKSGNEFESVFYYKELLVKISNYSKIATVLWKIGWYYENLGDYDNALDYYRKIYTYYPKHKLACEALFR